MTKSILLVPVPTKGIASERLPVNAVTVDAVGGPLEAPGPPRTEVSIAHPSAVFDSKSQWPQLGLPPTAGQLNVKAAPPWQVLRHPLAPQAALALGCMQLTQAVPDAHWVTSSLRAQVLLPQLWNPALHTNPQVMPLHVAALFAGTGHDVQEAPQVAGLVFDTHAPPHTWNPTLQEVQGAVVQKSTVTPTLAGRRTMSVRLVVPPAVVTTVTGSLTHVATVADVTEEQITLKMSAHNDCEPTGKPRNVVMKEAAPGVSPACSVVMRPITSDVSRMQRASDGTCVSSNCTAPTISAAESVEFASTHDVTDDKTTAVPSNAISRSSFLVMVPPNDRHCTIEKSNCTVPENGRGVGMNSMVRGRRLGAGRHPPSGAEAALRANRGCMTACGRSSHTRRG